MNKIRYTWIGELLLVMVITSLIISLIISIYLPISILSKLLCSLILLISSIIGAFFINKIIIRKIIKYTNSKPVVAEIIYQCMEFIGDLAISIVVFFGIIRIIEHFKEVNWFIASILFLIILAIIKTIMFSKSESFIKKRFNIKPFLLLFICLIIIITLFIINFSPNINSVVEKPVIYLYPEDERNVSVNIFLKDALAQDTLITYPEIDDGWDVIAYPNGSIVSHGEEYSYLFWEAQSNIEWDFSKGFVVQGENSLSFLENILPRMGLKPKEYHDFIVYWYPLMSKNKYNLVSFQTDVYEEHFILDIRPQPDSILRVFMVVKKIDAPIQIDPQEFKEFERKGFTVIEWGGSMVSEN